MPNKRSISPGRTYRRSQVAFCVGLIILAVTTGFANLLGTDKGDLFSGFMAGAGAIGALMAAYEAADAAEGSTEAARISNELAKRQFYPSIVVTCEAVRTPFEDEDGEYITELNHFFIDNVGQAFTCIDKWNLYIYCDGQRSSRVVKQRIPLPINSSETVYFAGQSSNYRDVTRIQGFAIELTTIHGSRHGCIGWINPDTKDFQCFQLKPDQEIPIAAIATK